MTGDIQAVIEGGVGRIRLNRPRAIHALTTAMCAGILDALAAWKNDDAVAVVMIDHAEGRGFCAGGDIRMLAESGAKDGVEARAFFHTEYRMNHRLFTYPKPIVAFMDGITMGGGVGISLPCRYRVATENTRFAMPETGIGLFPDVGGGWYLSRLPGRIGQYLALTGYRCDGAECDMLGLATQYVRSENIDLVKTLITKYPHDIDNIFAGYSSAGNRPALIDYLDDIDRLFASDRLADILAALDADGGEWARQQAAILAAKSPQTMMVALRQLREGAAMPDFAAEMAQEYAIGARIVMSADFQEGVRAVIIDKDNAPRWQAAPDDAAIDAIFAPLPPGEAWTPA